MGLGKAAKIVNWRLKIAPWAILLTFASPLICTSMFVHHVFFWLKNPSSAADKAALIAGLEKLKAAPAIATAHIGVPANTNRPVIDSSYAVSWLLTFANDEAQADYQTDPIHLQFIEECAALWERVVVYDSIDAE
jgi:Stress responsive A/B Barrel Domain